MNVDEAMADIENNIKNNPSKYSTHYKEVAETLVAEVKRLSGLLESVNAYCSEIEKRWAATQAELAEAKAASVVPDEEVQTAFDKWLEYECWECHRSICEVTWKAAIKWMKESGEG